VPALAVYAPNWERPVKQAEMVVLDADGFFDTAENVVLTQNRRDNSQQEASSLTLSFDLVNADGSVQKAQYEVPVESVSHNRCGGTAFVATLKLYNPDLATGYFPEIQIRLNRQTAMGINRACGGRASLSGPESSWNAEVKFFERGSVQSESTMILRGTPEALFTIQSMDAYQN
jgi:hypothetical protein